METKQLTWLQGAKKYVKENRSSERLFLDEAFLNGRIVNLEAKPFLLEVDGGTSYIEKCKKNPDLPLYLIGIAQSGDKPNRNGRIYPWVYLKRECIRYMENEVKLGLSYGELDHPLDSTTPSLDHACWTIEDIWFKDKDVWVKILVLSAYMPDNAPGKKIRGFLLNGKSVGISSRALGSLETYSETEYDVVAEDLDLICWDAVSNASNFGSEKLQMSESNQKFVKNTQRKQMLTESQIRTFNKGVSLQERKLINLTEEEKVYLNILGVKDFLRLKSLV
jgi:hypothetical protein